MIIIRIMRVIYKQLKVPRSPSAILIIISLNVSKIMNI